MYFFFKKDLPLIDFEE